MEWVELEWADERFLVRPESVLAITASGTGSTLHLANGITFACSLDPQGARNVLAGRGRHQNSDRDMMGLGGND